MSGPVFISMIAAVADNGVIGAGGRLPWHLPEDLAWFAKVTTNSPVIMGRKTWNSLPRKPLPHRPNFVVSRTNLCGTECGAVCFDALGKAVDSAARLAPAIGSEEIFVIGGASIYAEAIPFASRLYLTEIHASPDGDASFPDFDKSEWRETRRERRPSAAEDRPAYSLVVLDRISPSSDQPQELML